MKHYCQIISIFFTCWILSFSRAGAQSQVSDAQITYQVTVTLPSGTAGQATSAFDNSQLVYSFKNYLFRSDMQIGKRSYTNIRNSREHTAVSLVDNGGGVKYLIRYNADELANESRRFEGVTFTEGTGSKEIAGYKCTEATGHLKDGSTFALYYAPGLIPENKDYNARFTGLRGLPLAFETATSNGVKMTMTATSVNIAPQPRAEFNIPTSGYREISYTELENLRKNH